MNRSLPAFNLYLFIGLAASLILGCATTKDEDLTYLGLHLEVNKTMEDWSSPVPIYRANPSYVNVESEPFLSQNSVKEAEVIDTIGGFSIRIKFDQQGTRLLDQYTTAYRGKRIAIYAKFPQTRWLGAPRIRDRIQDGVLVFTPDATREEAERIVLGLELARDKIN